jgi:hypothetical protein
MMPDFLKIIVLGALFALSSKPVMASDQDTVAPVVFDLLGARAHFQAMRGNRPRRAAAPEAILSGSTSI